MTPADDPDRSATPSMPTIDADLPGPSYRAVADQLRQRISSGQWPPGHKLPSEANLLVQYGVSRVTVRHAVGLLRFEGLIVTRQGCGSFVRPHHPPQHLTRHGHNPDSRHLGQQASGAEVSIVWESVRARMPTPQEQQDLGLSTGVPVLVITRRTPTGPHDQPGDDALAAAGITTVLPADRVILHYLIDDPGDLAGC